MCQQPVCRCLRQDEAAVAPAVGIGEDVDGSAEACRHGDFRCIHAYLYLCGLCAVTYGHSDCVPSLTVTPKLWGQTMPRPRGSVWVTVRLSFRLPEMRNVMSGMPFS